MHPFLRRKERILGSGKKSQKKSTVNRAIDVITPLCAAAGTLLSRYCPGVLKRCPCSISRKVDERARCARIARFGSVETRSRSIRSGVALRIDEGKSVRPIESSYHVRSPSDEPCYNGTYSRFDSYVSIPLTV